MKKLKKQNNPYRECGNPVKRPDEADDVSASAGVSKRSLKAGRNQRSSRGGFSLPAAAKASVTVEQRLFSLRRLQPPLRG